MEKRDSLATTKNLLPYFWKSKNKGDICFFLIFNPAGPYPNTFLYPAGYFFNLTQPNLSLNKQIIRRKHPNPLYS